MSGMGVSVGSGYVDVEPRFDQFKQKLDREVGAATASVQDRIDKAMNVGDKMTARFTLPIVAGLGLASKAAADLNEAVNVTGLTFGDAADEIDAFAKDSVKLIGASEREAREYTATLGGLLANMGFAQDETVAWSKDLAVLAADMGSAFNTTTEDAIGAIGGALRGESEAIRRFNVMLDDASVRAKAVEMGLASTTSEVDKHAKAQATLALIMEQTSKVQGDWANTQDEATGQAKQAKAAAEDAAAAMGEALLPVTTNLAKAATGLAQGFAALPGPIQETATYTLAAVAALGPMLSVGTRTVKMLRDLKAAELGASASMAKFGIAVAGAAALAAGIDAVARSVVDAMKGAPPAVQDLALAFEGLAAAEKVPESVAGAMDGLGYAIERVANPHLTDDLWGPFNDPKADNAREKIANVDQALAGLVNSGNMEAATRGFNEIAIEALRQGVSIADLNDMLPDYAKSLDSAAIASGEYGESVSEFLTSTDIAARAQERLNAALAEHTERLRKATDPVYNLVSAMDAVDKAQQDYNDTLNDTEATQDDVERAALDLARAISDVEVAAANGDLSFDQFEAQLATWVRQGRLTADQADAIRRRVAEARGEAERFEGDYTATIRAELDERAWKATTDRLTALAQQHYNVTVGTAPRPAGTPSNAQRHGGPVHAGEIYSVGHGLGDEAFVPGADGYMLAAAETSASVERGVERALARMPAGGGVGTVVNVNVAVHGSLWQTEDLVEEVRRQFEYADLRNGR